MMKTRFRLPFVVAAVTAALVALAPGCGDADVDAILGPQALGGEGDGGGVFGDGGFDDAISAYCAGAGPLVHLPQGSCTGDIGNKTFPFAICSCTTESLSGTLRTDSFDSLGGTTTGNHGSIGATGALTSNARLDVKGSVYARGDNATPATRWSSQGSVTGEVHAGGVFAIDGTFTVGGDVFAAGGTSLTSGSLTTMGKLHVPSGAPTAGVTASGGVVNEPVTVTPPCDCSAPLDIGGIVASFKSSNDDAAIGLAPGMLANASGKTITLPCGRYYVDAIGGDGVTLKLTGRTAIFVAGDMNVTGALTLDLAPQAELDLFVAGSFSITGSTAFGSLAAPARVRVYVGGPSVTLSGVAGIGANLYAPNAEIDFASAFEMSGAIFAKRIALSGDFTIHYDEAILDVQGCKPPGGGCSSCHDCSGATPACRGGSCVPCQTDSDCCAPLLCNAGRCQIQIR